MMGKPVNERASGFDFLIIGNSAAGVSAAEAIRKADPDSSICMVSNEPYPAYGRPLISYLIEGKTSEERIWLKPEDFYRTNRVETLFGSEYEVIELKPDEHTVLLSNGDSISYGKCLLATGSVPFVPPIEGLDELSEVYGFMTLDDAKAARDAVSRATEQAHSQGRESRVMVIGAGLIGLKAAEALSHHSDEILVLELAPRILPAVLDAEGAEMLQQRLKKDGITCMPGVSVKKFIAEEDVAHSDDEDGSYSGSPLGQAVLTNGDEVSFDVVITAVGVRPNSKLAVDAGAEQNRGLVCDEHLRTSLDDVYAAGDVVQVRDVLDGSERPLALWPNAVSQGRIAGLSMVDSSDAETFEGSFAVNAVDFFDVSLLTCGLINPPEDSKCDIDVFVEGDSYVKFVKRDGKLVGYILMNRPEGAGMYTYMIENETPLDDVSEDAFEHPLRNLDFGIEARWERLHPKYPKQLDKLGRKIPRTSQTA